MHITFSLISLITEDDNQIEKMYLKRLWELYISQKTYPNTQSHVCIFHYCRTTEIFEIKVEELSLLFLRSKLWLRLFCHVSYRHLKRVHVKTIRLRTRDIDQYGKSHYWPPASLATPGRLVINILFTVRFKTFSSFRCINAIGAKFN